MPTKQTTNMNKNQLSVNTTKRGEKVSYLTFDASIAKEILSERYDEFLQDSINSQLGVYISRTLNDGKSVNIESHGEAFITRLEEYVADGRLTRKQGSSGLMKDCLEQKRLASKESDPTKRLAMLAEARSLMERAQAMMLTELDEME